MSFFTVPTTLTPEDTTHYTQTVALDGKDFEFRFDYLQAQNQWVFSLYTATLAPLLLGVPIVAGVDLLARCRVLERPGGSLFLVPGKADPGLLDLGEGRAERLVYATASEIA